MIKQLTALVTGASLVLAAAASTASAGTTFSASDDAGKYSRDKGRSFVSMLSDIGFTENRITVRWHPDRPTTIVDKPFLDKYVPKATRQGIKIVLAVYPETATAITAGPERQSQFVAFLTRVARQYSQATKIIVGNEPNQPHFWQPQFDANGNGVAGAAYESLLAQSYDALKAQNPHIVVVGVGVNSRGNDNPSAPSNVSTSPVKFIRDMAAAYRTSARTAPIMDEIAFHPYPAESTDPISKGFLWPNAGFVNNDRIKQAVWDGFHGTGQPVFAENGSGGGLQMRIDEVAWQTAVPRSSAHAYTGAENVATADDQLQASVYADLVKQSQCDASLSALSFFGIIDEPQLAAFQGGLVRADGSLRPSYDAVRSAIKQSAGRCDGQPTTWSHANAIAGARATWGKLTPRPAHQTSWAFQATATEDVTFRAGIFPVKARGASGAAIQRSLSGKTSAKRLVAGAVKAYYVPRVQFPKQQLPAGRYVYAIRMSATVNPERTSFFVSKPFRVGPKPTS